uniref:Uncharacterized protein n=1 Tax=Lactuca sativa TaxID=4236 RepID=A0A9R1W4S4_LACSA|nr:hypothetical protein LSAT_V11C200074480 [Lactuca sativa]
MDTIIFSGLQMNGPCLKISWPRLCLHLGEQPIKLAFCLSILLYYLFIVMLDKLLYFLIIIVLDNCYFAYPFYKKMLFCLSIDVCYVYSQIRNYRPWTSNEEAKLVEVLLNMRNVEGFKVDNGFKFGYLQHLEQALKQSLPNSDLLGKPHVESKIKTKKKIGNVAMIW